jgi:glyoxylase-like metal-dependent hydrolase (beta-lactamase superfamily II)
MAERDWDEIAQGVFRKRFEPCDVTVTAVVGSEGVAVVDTRCSLTEAREIKAQLRQLTSAPVQWVVNTHAHFDHCWGNAEFVAPRLTPPARIWGHASVPARLDPDDPALRSLIAELAAQGPEWVQRMAELEFAAPTELVRERASIDLGDRALELRFLGRGHTEGDLWISITAGAAGIVLAGDLVEESGPPAFGLDSFPLEWADTLDRALPLIGPDALVVPGHGTVVDAAFVREQRDAIASVAAEIQRLHAAGIPVESAASAGTWPIEPKALGFAITRGYAALA